MELIILRYQISIFGSFDEIKPSAENIKFFIDKFTDKGFIPNQFTEVRVEINSGSNKGIETTKNTEISRLRLNDSDKKWDIRFASNKIDFLFVNSNIGQIEMIDKGTFISEFIDFTHRINEKYQIKAKRIGLITQYLYKDIDLNKTSTSFQNNISFFDQKPIVDLNTKVSTRHKIENTGEIANVAIDIRRLQRPMKINNDTSFFDGILMNIDINTLAENESYRFTVDNIPSLINDFSNIQTTVFNEANSKLQ